jgi:hypothetical protein
MSWCCIFGTHAISLCATKQEGNGRAIGKTFEKTTPEHLKMSAHVRVNGKMTSAGGEPRMHVSSALWRKIRSNAARKKTWLIGRKLYHAMSFVGPRRHSQFQEWTDLRGPLISHSNPSLSSGIRVSCYASKMTNVPSRWNRFP